MTPNDVSARTSTPSGDKRPDAPAGAGARVKARRRRVALIRKRTLAVAGSSFALLWGVIFVQLVSGHDPALAKKATAAATSTPSSGSTSSGSTSSGSTSSGSSSSDTSGSGSTSAITTSQS